MTDKETLLLVIKISILFLLLCVLYQITNENNNCQNERNINLDEPKSIELDDTYSCDPTNKTVTNSKEHTPDRNCLLQKGTSGCNQTHFGGVEQVKQTVENVIASSKESCQGLLPRRTSRIQEDCHYVSPYLLRDVA